MNGRSCRLGIGTSDQEIEDLAAALMELPVGHPLEHLLLEAPDFRRKDALADALLHPQDRAYSVPQLFEYLERGGLSFGRWVRQAPYLARCGVLAATPHAPRLAQLPAQEGYAAVELFRGTMLRHSLVAYRTGRRGDGQPVRFDDELLRFRVVRCQEPQLDTARASNPHHGRSLPLAYRLVHGLLGVLPCDHLIPQQLELHGHSRAHAVGARPVSNDHVWPGRGSAQRFGGAEQRPQQQGEKGEPSER